MFDFSAKIPSITNFANKCDFLKIIRENERVKILALRNISSGSTKVMNLAVNHCLHFCLENHQNSCNSRRKRSENVCHLKKWSQMNS